jgi:hypothetical protein
MNRINLIRERFKQLDTIIIIGFSNQAKEISCKPIAFAAQYAFHIFFIELVHIVLF